LTFLFITVVMTNVCYGRTGDAPLRSSTDFRLIAREGKVVLQAHSGMDSTGITVGVNGDEKQLLLQEGHGVIEAIQPGDRRGQLYFIVWGKHRKLYHISHQDGRGELRVVHLPLWLSIIPPLVAILLALLFREVILSLFTGVFAGAFIAGGMRFDSLYYYFDSFVRTINGYLIDTLRDPDHLAVILFSLLIGGMVAIISRNGGMAGVVKSLSRHARSPVSTQFMTWLMGVAIFFDDYANTLIVGNTMRNITDRFRISREKLAYIVDSTAAPVAAIAFITTWIGAELGYIADGVAGLEGFDSHMTPYAIFLQSLKYAYYPVLTLIFILLIVFLRRDFGPMYRAEVRARTTGKVSSATKGIDDEPDMEDLSPVEGIAWRWYNAVLPVLIVILVTILGLLQTGFERSHILLLEIDPFITGEWSVVWDKLDLLTDGPSGGMVRLGTIIGNADSFAALIWGSLSGMATALILTLGQRLMKLNDTVFTLLTGFKTMVPALVILCLAWSLAITTRELHTAEFITSALHGYVNPYFMPAIVFILSGLIAFSTGSSWSTMAILFPIAIPATWAIASSSGLPDEVAMELLFNVIRGILGAAVLGDHISPISDTTILSSLASDCNHLDHVKTQMPYALTVGLVSIVSITVAAIWGGTFFMNSLILIFDVALLFLVVRYIGKPVPPFAES
jgi:Na+/H+ antiporter NhaC